MNLKRIFVDIQDAEQFNWYKRGSSISEFCSLPVEACQISFGHMTILFCFYIAHKSIQNANI